MAARLGRAPRWLGAEWGLGLLVFAGCAVAPIPRPVVGRIPAEGVGALVRRWEAEWREFQGLRAAVDLNVVRKGQAQRSAGVLLLSPTRLRFEAISPLGLPVVVVTAGPDRVLVLSLIERRGWTGRPTPEALSRWLGFSVEPETLIRLLAGRVPLPRDPSAVRLAQDQGSPHLAFERNGVRHRVWVTEDGSPLGLQLENGDRVTATFERAPDNRLESVRVAVPGQALNLELRYLGVESVSPLGDAFEITVPPGITIERVD